MVEEMSHYAREVLGDAAAAKWVDAHVVIWAFLGFTLLMGISRLPQLHLHWNTDLVFHYFSVTE